MMPGCLCDLVERYVLMTLDQVIKPARYGCRMSTQWIIGWSLLAKERCARGQFNQMRLPPHP
jgi:hypothetical protein